MSRVSVVRFAARGGIVGLLVPATVFAIFSALAKSNIALGEHLITALPVFAAALLELPGVAVGRTLGLPIETRGPAFIVYNLNAFGFVLVLMVWCVFASVIGAAVGAVQSATSTKPTNA